MDFIEQLPGSTGFTAILVVVDRLSKQAIFIPTHDTITSPELAKLFLLHMFSKHGVPAHVTSDRGTEFVSHFFRSLRKALDMCLHFTSGYHPEGDGQTEWCRGGLGVAAASGEARSTQGLLEVWQSSQGLGKLGELGRVVVVQSLQD